MKCAGELIAISLKVEEERKLEREKTLSALKERTIVWCEKIGKMMEARAMNAQPLEHSILLMRGGDGETYYSIKETLSRYRNNREDYKIYWNYGFHLPTIIEFFEKYCFKVILETSNYPVYSYGFGYFTICTLTIKPAPQCF